MPYLNSTSCCGVMEMEGMGGYVLEEGHTDVPTVRELRRQLSLARMDRAGMVFATTNQRQKKSEPALKAAGFRCVRKFRNPNTRNMVKFWMASTARA